MIEAVSTHITNNPGHGFGLLYKTLHADPWLCGKTRLWRVYCELKLNRPPCGKKRLPTRIREPLIIPLQQNATWSADFMSDALWAQMSRARKRVLLHRGTIFLRASIPS